MRRLVLSLVACALVVPAVGQSRGFASINSVGAQRLGPAPASVLSPNPLVQGSHDRGFYGPQAHIKTFEPVRPPHHPGCRGCYVRPYPPAIYYPYPYYDYGYGYYGGPVIVEDRSSLPYAGTFRTADSEDNASSAVPAPTIYENRPSGAYYRPNAGSNSVMDEQRYGEHYTDGRERAPESRGVVTTNGAENSDVTTLLIFKNGDQLEVTNFAIMGDYVFVFAGNRRKIPLAELNLDATQKANEERGTEFHLPRVSNPS